MFDDKLVRMLWCPTCQAAELRCEPSSDGADPALEATLICDACGSTYPVQAGTPVMLPRTPLNSEAWDLWRRHLKKFEDRREERIRNPNAPVVRLTRTQRRPHRPFAAFTGITEGTVLDVGCGHGGFRRNFDPAKVTYVGLDPLTLPEERDFPLLRGIAEYLPFKDGTFTDIVVLAALDHFREPERFFDEARRILQPGGRLHILQSVHELRGPVSAVKMLSHMVKDLLEERNVVVRDAPKHISEFTTRSLVERTADRFDVVKLERYNPIWYSPDKLFLSLSPRPAGNGIGAASQRARAGASAA